MSDSLCIQIGVDMFFPEDGFKPVGEFYKQAKKVCNKCPVIEQCGEYGKDEHYGIWGGTTPRTRQATRNRLKKESKIPNLIQLHKVKKKYKIIKTPKPKLIIKNMAGSTDVEKFKETVKAIAEKDYKIIKANNKIVKIKINNKKENHQKTANKRQSI